MSIWGEYHETVKGLALVIARELPKDKLRMLVENAVYYADMFNTYEYKPYAAPHTAICRNCQMLNSGEVRLPYYDPIVINGLAQIDARGLVRTSFVYWQSPEPCACCGEHVPGVRYLYVNPLAEMYNDPHNRSG